MSSPMPGPFLLYFDFDSAKVTAEGRKIVASAAAAVAAAKPAAVIVTGHADRAGRTPTTMRSRSGVPKRWPWP